MATVGGEREVAVVLAEGPVADLLAARQIDELNAIIRSVGGEPAAVGRASERRRAAVSALVKNLRLGRRLGGVPLADQRVRRTRQQSASVRRERQRAHQHLVVLPFVLL